MTLRPFLVNKDYFPLFVCRLVHPSATSPRHKMSGVKWGDAIVLYQAAWEVIAEWGKMGLGCGRHAGKSQKKCEIAWKKSVETILKSVENGVKSSFF